jgi:AAA+ ATPase superfamily predicted ATPase
MESAAFIDREKELAFLESKWEEGKAQLIVLWGKRRVGKTELVKRFIQGKPHVYHLGQSTGDKEQLDRFSRALGVFFREPLLGTRGFAAWEESFKYVQQKETRFVLVIDEFPYLIQSNPAIPGLFQTAWDEYWAKSKVYVILLGSSVSMMETEVLGHRAPLFGRRTGQWKVQPMPFTAVGGFRSAKSFEDRLMHYGVAGGTPAYWLRFGEKKTFDDNLRDHVLRKGEMLYDEVEFLLREEVREPRFYFSLLQAIALGKRKLSEIVNATGITQSMANKYLGVLADLDIVERELPVTEEKPLKSKKGLYRIKDEFVQFWFRFVFPRRADLEMGEIDRVLASIREGLPQYLSGVYEKVAGEILLANALPFPFERLGRWWTKDAEIDLVGFNKDQNKIFFAEVKWTEKPVGTNILDALKEKARQVSWGDSRTTRFYALFSRKGFTKDMRDRAREHGIILFEGEKALQIL